MADQKFRSISIELDTYEKLMELAARNYRSVPKEISRLVDIEIERARNGTGTNEAVPARERTA